MPFQSNEIYIYIILGIFIWLLSMAIATFFMVCMWKIFVKAGKPGWAALIQFYNTLNILEFLGRPWWWLLLMLIPLANLVISIIIVFDYAKSFGKSTGFGFGLLFLTIIFIPIMAFDSSKYIGPATSL
jgi:hypothetical protein